MSKSAFGFPGADDPAYAHEQEQLAEFCRAFLAAHEAGDFDAMLFITGQITAQTAALWKLSPPGGLLHPSVLFLRDGESLSASPVSEEPTP